MSDITNTENATESPQQRCKFCGVKLDRSQRSKAWKNSAYCEAKHRQYQNTMDWLHKKSQQLREQNGVI